MNIIERIDEQLYKLSIWQECLPVRQVLNDCKLEIERLTLANETLKGLCEDYQAQIKQQREYTPMTDNEWQTHYNSTPDKTFNDIWFYERLIEAEVIKRANLVVKENV